MDDCVFCSCSDAQFSCNVLKKKSHFVRGSCDKSLKLDVMFGGVKQGSVI